MINKLNDLTIFLTVNTATFATLTDFLKIRIFDNMADVAIYFACAVLSRFVSTWLQNKCKNLNKINENGFFK